MKKYTLHVTIYDYRTGVIIITDDDVNDLHSQLICDGVVEKARAIARKLKRSVVVEDCGARDFYRVMPTGCLQPVPPVWGKPEWEEEDE